MSDRVFLDAPVLAKSLLYSLSAKEPGPCADKEDISASDLV